MITDLPRPVQKLLALLILATVIGALIKIVSPAVTVFTEKFSQAERLSDKKSRYQTLIEREELIDKNLAQLQRDKVRGGLFLEGEKITIASATLQSFINQMVKESGGQLVSTQDYRPATDLPGLNPVGLTIQISGETGHLIKLLHELESTKPLIFIDQLSITSLSRRNANPETNQVSQRRRAVIQQRGPRYSLTIRMNIVSYLAGRGDQ